MNLLRSGEWTTSATSSIRYHHFLPWYIIEVIDVPLKLVNQNQNLKFYKCRTSESHNRILTWAKHRMLINKKMWNHFLQKEWSNVLKKDQKKQIHPDKKDTCFWLRKAQQIIVKYHPIKYSTDSLTTRSNYYPKKIMFHLLLPSLALERQRGKLGPLRHTLQLLSTAITLQSFVHLIKPRKWIGFQLVESCRRSTI